MPARLAGLSALFCGDLGAGLVGRRAGGCAIGLCGFKEQGAVFVILAWFAERFNRGD